MGVFILILLVGSSHRLSEVERTTPAAPSKERDHLLDGAATPPLPRRGLRLSRRLSQTPVSSGRLVGNAQTLGEGGAKRPGEGAGVARILKPLPCSFREGESLISVLCCFTPRFFFLSSSPPLTNYR